MTTVARGLLKPNVMYKVLITTSGIGSRLGSLTKYTNKGLVPIGKKPAISYIVEKYADDVPLVITLGYFGNHMREFLTMAYPKKKFEFVPVDLYDGPGSSLGYSMLKAKETLQCPFIFHAVDTIVTEPIPAPNENWAAGFKGPDAKPYTSFTVSNDGVITKMQRKGADKFDFLHIGLVGIKDYGKFWEALETAYQAEKDNKELNDVLAISRMVDAGIPFKVEEYHAWLDTGNPESLAKTRKHIAEDFVNLAKSDEAIFFIDSYIIKFFADSNVVTERVNRAKSLAGLVPHIDASGENFYRYTFVEGDLLSEVASKENFPGYLEWLKKNLWRELALVPTERFQKVCEDFYIKKTKERLQRLQRETGIIDREQTINGEVVPTVEKMLGLIDIKWLSSGIESQFHGDLVLDNVLKTPEGFCLLDWRQNFGGLTEAGDRYYDFAKMSHNLTVNHGIIHQNKFRVEVNGTEVRCEIERKANLVDCEKILFDFFAAEGIDAKKVRVLTALVWLNMSPLHEHPLSEFLFYFGKLHLWHALKNQ